MKANELRINNLVYFEDEILKFEFESGWNFDFIKPIPLTQEWLLKFGFIKRPFQGKDFFVIDNIELYFTERKEFKGWIFNLNENDLRGIHFVHQLQNLYFALTGEELTLKETE